MITTIGNLPIENDIIRRGLEGAKTVIFFKYSKFESFSQELIFLKLLEITEKFKETDHSMG